MVVQVFSSSLQSFFSFSLYFRSFGSVEPKVLTKKDVTNYVVKGTKHVISFIFLSVQLLASF